MKRLISTVMVLGLCAFIWGCEKKADEPMAVEEDEIVVEEVQPAAPAAPAAEQPEVEGGEDKAE